MNGMIEDLSINILVANNSDNKTLDAKWEHSSETLPNGNQVHQNQRLLSDQIDNLSMEGESSGNINDETQENRVHEGDAPVPLVDMATLAESIKSPSDGRKKFFVTACTMVRNEGPYIVEWIEFHRIQGVERIIIYDHRSADNVTLLNELYQQQVPSFPLVVLPAIDVMKVGENLQQLNFQHCLETYGPSTEWIVNLDVDEFLHSPAFGTITALLRNMSVIERERNLSFVDFTSVNLNFGSSGQLYRFENRLTRGPDGRVVHENGCGLQLITDHVLRGPIASYGNEAALYKELTDGLWVCELKGFFSPCRHNPGKTLVRPEVVELAGIHVPDKMRRTGDQIYWNPRLLVGNHYYYRSREDVMLKAKQWRNGTGLPEHFRNFNLTDKLLWSSLRDEALHNIWGSELALRLQRLTGTGGSCLHGVGRGAN